MEQRKLIRLGNSSFAISLPKEWIDKSGLKKGDKIFVEANSNGELMIAPEFKRIAGEEKKIINIEGKNDREIRREIIDSYINGYIELALQGNTSTEQARDIKNIIANLLSLEIIKQTRNEIIIKDFFNLEDLDLNYFIRRISNNLNEMLALLEKGFKTKFDFKIINELKEIDYDINKFYFFFSRIMTNGINNPSFINELHTEPILLFNYWWVAFHLEAIGDNIKEVAKIMYKVRNKQSKQIQILPLLARLKNFYSASLETFYSKDREKAKKLVDEGQNLFEEAEKLMLNSESVRSLILDRIGRVEDHIYQITKMVIYLKEENKQ